MADPTCERDPVELLATEFLDRRRRGERPTVNEYAEQYPQWADQIRDLFPTIAAMEQLKTSREQGKGEHGPLGDPGLERLGDFRIIREIGRGGMGIVYEAEQESLRRRVAVKVMPRQVLLGSQHLQRFQREAQVAARLHHTNIVPVFGVGQQDGYHYYVMQFIPGVGLDNVLGRLREIDSAEVPAPARPLGGAFPCPADGRSGTQTVSDNGSAGDAAGIARSLLSGRFEPASRNGPPSNAVAIIEGRPSSAPHSTAPHPSPASTADTQPFPGKGSTWVAQRGSAPHGDSRPRMAGRSTSRFDDRYWRSVARIGLQVADALRYAHAQGTLHRDIKPANLLLDWQGIVCVADFGLAKAVGDDNVSRTGDVVGTLRYMAPEVFRGLTDARSDLYSLGLTLYELLTLQPAYEDTDPSRLIHKITSEEPARPRKLRPEIPRDLETIVLKSIARDPARRYQSAAALEADLQCFMEDRPIAARRVSPPERLWRWARRNPALASLSAVALALLTLVAVVATAGYVQTKKANVEVGHALTRESQQRKRAEATSELAVEALDRIFDRFAPDRITGTSSMTLEGTEGDQIEVPIQVAISKETAAILEDMLAFYHRLAEQGDENDQIRRKAAEASRRVGNIRQSLGQYDQAKAAYLRAIELYHQLAAESSDDVQFQPEIARVHNDTGMLYRVLRQPEEESASHGKALELLQAAGATSSAEPDHQYLLALTYYYLGRKGPPDAEAGPPPSMHGPPPREPGPPRRGPGSARRGPGPPRRPRDPLPPGPGEHEGFLGGPPPRPPQREAINDRGEEEDYMGRAIDLLGRLADQHPTMPKYRHLLALCYRDMHPPWPGGARDSASDTLSKAIAILENLVEEFPHVPDYRYDLSETYASVAFRRPPFAPDAPSEAQQRLRKALELSRQLVADHPGVPDYAASQVRIHLMLAEFLRREDQRAEAEESLREALALQAPLVQRFPEIRSYPFWLAVVQQSLARLLRDPKELEEARALMVASIDTLTQSLKDDPRPNHVRWLLVGSHFQLADIYTRLDKEDLAEEARRQAQNYR